MSKCTIEAVKELAIATFFYYTLLLKIETIMQLPLINLLR